MLPPLILVYKSFDETMGSEDIPPQSPMSNLSAGSKFAMPESSGSPSLERRSFGLPTKLTKLVIPKPTDYKTEKKLNDGYEPQPFDVICSRHKENATHPGNLRFRLCVEMRLQRYVDAQSRREKTKIVKEIIDAVRASGGKFIRQQATKTITDEGIPDAASSADVARKQQPKLAFYDIGNKRAADKISHALRFASLASDTGARRKSWPAGAVIHSKQRRETELFLEPHPTLCIAFKEEVARDKERSQMTLNQQRNHSVMSGIAYQNFALNADTVLNDVPAAIPSSDLKNRRQSWHGSTEERKLDSGAEFHFAFSTESDSSLSSKEWNLSNLQNEVDEDRADARSFGKLPSETKKLSIGHTDHDILDDDDDRSWDDSLF